MSSCDRLGSVSQYDNSPLYQLWLNSYSDRAKEICEAYGTLELFFDIDTASGVWLDLIGIIIGQPREVIDSSLVNWFSHENVDPLNSGFGVGKFWDGKPLVGGNILIDDPDYRKVIKARAFKNNSGTTINDIENSVFLLLGRSDCKVLDGGLEDVGGVTPELMEFALEFDGPIDDDDRVLILALDLLPRPAGVAITTVIP